MKPNAFLHNVCGNCGAQGVPLIEGQCVGCRLKTQQQVEPVLVDQHPDPTQERINVRDAIVVMYERIKALGFLNSHRGIYLDSEGDKIAVKVFEGREPSEYFIWAQYKCERGST